MLGGIRTYVTLVAITVGAGTLGYYYTQNRDLTAKLNSAETRLTAAEANLVVHQMALAQAKTARVVLESHLDRVAAQAEHWRQTASDLSAKEGANEALNPYERAVLDSLRRP